MLLILLKWHLLIKGHTTLDPSRLPWPGLHTGTLNPGGHPHWPVTCCSQKQQLFLDLPPLDDPTAPASTSVLELPHLARTPLAKASWGDIVRDCSVKQKTRPSPQHSSSRSDCAGGFNNLNLDCLPQSDPHHRLLSIDANPAGYEDQPTVS